MVGQQDWQAVRDRKAVQVRARDAEGDNDEINEPEIEARHFNFYYGDFNALADITMIVPKNQITALIGPSGSGKSTLLRAMNRMHDRTPGAHSDGALLLEGQDINAFT